MCSARTPGRAGGIRTSSRCSSTARVPASGGCGAALSQRNIKPTVFGVATALMRNPDCVAAMNEAGWDIASHGLKWIEHKDMSEAEERAAIAEAVRAPHARRPGSGRSAGTRAARSENTLKLVIEQGGFLYSCNSYADDLPYWVKYRERAAPDHSLHARRQRHALHQHAGFWRRRGVLPVPEGQF